MGIQVCKIPGQPFYYMLNTSDIMNISFGPGQYLPSPLICKQVTAFGTQSDDTAMADIGTHTKRVHGVTHVIQSHAGDSVGRNVRIVQSSSSLAFLSSVRLITSYFHFFLSLSMTNIIRRIFLIVDTCANLPDPFLFFTEV